MVTRSKAPLTKAKSSKSRHSIRDRKPATRSLRTFISPASVKQRNPPLQTAATNGRLEDWKIGRMEALRFKTLKAFYTWRAAVPRLSGNIVFRTLIKALIAATDLEGCGPGCGPSQPLKPLWALFCREFPVSTSGIPARLSGYDGECVSTPVTKARENLGGEAPVRWPNRLGNWPNSRRRCKRRCVFSVFDTDTTGTRDDGYQAVPPGRYV